MHRGVQDHRLLHLREADRRLLTLMLLRKESWAQLARLLIDDRNVPTGAHRLVQWGSTLVGGSFYGLFELDIVSLVQF